MLDEGCNDINAVHHEEGNGTLPLVHCQHVIIENLRGALQSVSIFKYLCENHRRRRRLAGPGCVALAAVHCSLEFHTVGLRGKPV